MEEEAGTGDAPGCVIEAVAFQINVRTGDVRLHAVCRLALFLLDKRF